MDGLSNAAWRAERSRRVAARGSIRPGQALILAAALVVVVVAGVALKYWRSSQDSASGAESTVATAATAVTGPREIDFGFAELNRGLPTPITSFKNGGAMVVYAGEELRFQVLGDAPLPQIEMRVGDSAQALPGTDGEVRVAGPANRPLPLTMAAQDTRLSLPGSAPPRVSVKVQVFGAARPK